MDKPEDPFESTLFDVAHALIDGLPDSWHAAHLRVQVMTHGDQQGMGRRSRART